MASYIETLRLRVRASLEQGETLGSLARKAGLHRNSLYGFDQPGWDPKASTLDKLEQHLP